MVLAALGHRLERCWVRGSGGSSLPAPGLPGPRVVCFLDAMSVQPLQGESGGGGGCMFACVVSHACMCALVCTALHICGGMCICGCCPWAGRGGRISRVQCSLHPGMSPSPPSHPRVLRAAPRPELCSQKSKSWEASPPPNSDSSRFSAAGRSVFSPCLQQIYSWVRL